MAGHAAVSEGAIDARISDRSFGAPAHSVAASRISPASFVAALTSPNRLVTSKICCGDSQPAPLRRATTMSSLKLLDVERRVQAATAPCGWRTSVCRMRRSYDGFGGLSPSSSST